MRSADPSSDPPDGGRPQGPDGGTPGGQSTHPDRPPSPSRGWRDLLGQAVHPGWSDRNFDFVFAARVAMSAGRALAGVVTPVYLALQGFSALGLSEYFLVVAITSALLSASIGLLADHIGRRPFLVALPLLTAAAAITYAITFSTPLLFVMGALGSFGRGAGAGAGAVGPYQPAELAFVTDDLPARHRNAAFGRLAFGSSVGATLGGVLALVVPSTHRHGAAALADYRTAFLAIAAVSALAGLLALALVESRPQQPPAAQEDDSATAGRRRPRLPPLPTRSRWLLYRLWVTNTLNGMAIGMFGPFITYWLYRRYGVGPAEIGTLFAVINVVTMASTLSAASLARRWGLVRTVTVVRSAQALLLIPMVLAPTFVLAGAVYLVRMTVQRIGLPLRQSYAVALADPKERASVAALSNVPSQLAMSATPLLTGYLFDEVSLSLPFEIAAGLQFMNATTFWIFFRHHPPEEEEPKVAPATQDVG